MKTRSIVVLFLLALVITTVAGMVLESDSYWQIHNYASILLSLLCVILLVRRK